MKQILILCILFYSFFCPCAQDQPLIMFEQDEASITKLVKLAKAAHHAAMSNGSQISFNNAISLHLKREALLYLQNKPNNKIELYLALESLAQPPHQDLQTCGPATILDTSVTSHTKLIVLLGIPISWSNKRSFARVLVSSDFFKTLPQRDQTIHFAIDDDAAQRLLEAQA